MNFGRKTITVPGTDPNDTNIAPNAINNASRSSQDFYFDGGEDVNCVAVGSTIKTGYPRTSAYGSTAKTSKNGNEGDLNIDWTVNAIDS